MPSVTPLKSLRSDRPFMNLISFYKHMVVCRVRLDLHIIRLYMTKTTSEPMQLRV